MYKQTQTHTHTQESHISRASMCVYVYAKTRCSFILHKVKYGCAFVRSLTCSRSRDIREMQLAKAENMVHQQHINDDNDDDDDDGEANS